MPEDRSIENKFVILALLQKAQERGSEALTRIQVHKLLFVSEQEMWKKKILSTGFRFIKMEHGPWSIDIENTIEQLRHLGLVQTETVTTRRGDYAKLASLTDSGVELVNSIMRQRSAEPQEMVLEAIGDAILRYGEMSSEELAELSHEFRNLKTGKTVHDTPPRQYLLVPRTMKQAAAVLELEESVSETLEVMEDEELQESILLSIEQARQGKFRPYRVGGDSGTDEAHRGN